MTQLAITLLYVPGDRPDRIAKAMASDADVVLIDLEDAVTPEHKDAARDTMMKTLAENPNRRVQVRINPPGTRWHDADVAAATALPPTIGIRLPKCEEPEQVAEMVGRLAPHPTHLLIESALGVEAAFDLARCHDAIATIGLGEADLRADLGVSGSAGLLYSRSRVVTAAAAAGLPAPAMSVFTDVRDFDGLRTSTEEGRTLGFLGRAAIHPRQLPIITDAFAPEPDEVRRAEEIIAAASNGRDQGNGAVALPDGRFVDAAVVRQARLTLAIAEQRRMP